MPTDFTRFHRVLHQLSKALVRAEAAPTDEELRDAVIQRFEYSYETAWKFLQRHLADEGVETVAAFTRRELFREAARRGILQDPEAWFGYQKARNETSHTYDEQRAAEVYSRMRPFLADAQKLLRALEERATRA